MAKYDGLIIPRSYSEYINKTDAATHQQAHQVNGVLDTEPTENSNKAVKSGGVFDAIADAQSDLQDEIDTKQDILTFDDVPTEDSDNPVKSGGIYDELETKQDTLIFDNTPTANSDNPVKSGGVKSYVDGMIPDYSQILQSGIPAAGYTPNNDCYLVVCYIAVRSASTLCELYINGTKIAQSDYSTISGSQIVVTLAWAGFIKAGQKVQLYINDSPSSTAGFRFYALSR